MRRHHARGEDHYAVEIGFCRKEHYILGEKPFGLAERLVRVRRRKTEFDAGKWSGSLIICCTMCHIPYKCEVFSRVLFVIEMTNSFYRR